MKDGLMVLDILALGVDPEKAIFFPQSMVPEHTELAWIFNSVTGHGDRSVSTIRSYGTSA